MSADVSNSTPGSINELLPGMELRGKVKRLELVGAFVDIGLESDALLHISQLNQPNVRNVEDVLKVGEEITVYILKVDKESKRVALSMTKPAAVNWGDLKPGDAVTGKVVRIESFGVFLDIGAERPGMVHVSEMASGYVKSPEDVVSMGQEVEARILKIDRKKRQIDLTMKMPEPSISEMLADEEEEQAVPTAMELALRQAMSRVDDVVETKSSAQERTRSKKRRSSQVQDDIISRTLRKHQTD
jgi:ribosomal protein S1